MNNIRLFIDDLKKNIIADDYTFFIATATSIFVSYFLFGVGSITFSAVAVLFAFIIDSAKQNNGDYFYTLFWLLIILAGGYVGFRLKMSIEFYVLLFFISNFYYRAFDVDPYAGRAVPFMVILATIGTVLTKASIADALSYCIGSVCSVLAIAIAHRNKVEFTAFKYGLFSKALYMTNRHVFISSFVYSIFLFLTVFLPHHFLLRNVYWAAITFVILVKPKTYRILSDTLTRFFGCILGGGLTIGIINLGIYSKVLVVIIIAICIFLTPTLLNLNRVMKSFAITVFVLLVIEYASFWHDTHYLLAWARIYETLIGGTLAILASIVLYYVDKIKSPF